MRTVHLMKKMSDASKNIFRKNNCTQKKMVHTTCQECVRAYLSIHDCLSFRHEVMIGNHRNKTTES